MSDKAEVTMVVRRAVLHSVLCSMKCHMRCRAPRTVSEAFELSSARGDVPPCELGVWLSGLARVCRNQCRFQWRSVDRESRPREASWAVKKGDLGGGGGRIIMVARAPCRSSPVPRLPPETTIASCTELLARAVSQSGESAQSAAALPTRSWARNARSEELLTRPEKTRKEEHEGRRLGSLSEESNDAVASPAGWVAHAGAQGKTC